MGFVGDGIHVHVAQFGIHFLDVRLQIGVDGWDIFVRDAGYVKVLPGTQVEGAVAPGFGDVLYVAEILGVHRSAGHAHLQHELAGHLGLPVAVQPDFLMLMSWFIL